MKDETTGENQAENQTSQQPRIYFDWNNPEVTKAGAFDLTKEIFDLDVEPEILARIFAALYKQCATIPELENGLLALIQACFNYATQWGELPFEYANACLALPIGEEGLSDIDNQKVAATTFRSRRIQNPDLPSKAHWIPRFCNALADAIDESNLPQEVQDILMNGFTDLIRFDDSDVIRVEVPEMLYKLTGKKASQATQGIEQVTPNSSTETPPETITYNLCDYGDVFSLHCFDSNDDDVIKLSFVREGADQLKSIFAMVELAGRERTELTIMDIYAPARKNAEEFREKITLPDKCVLHFVGFRDTPIITMKFERSEGRISNVLQMHDESGNIYRTVLFR